MRRASRFLVRFLPLGAYWSLARLRARILSRGREAPHVVENLQSCDVGRDLTAAELDRIRRRHLESRILRSASRSLPRLNGFAKPGRWEIRGSEHLDEALRGGRGAILATAHIGYSVLITPILRVRGYPIHEISGIASATRATRETAPGIEANLNVRPIFDALTKNEAVFLSVDGMRAVEFAVVNLLGRSFPLATGPVKIAAATGAPLLPVFAVEESRSAMPIVEIAPPVKVDPGAGPAENLQRFADVFDARLRNHPHAWALWSTHQIFDRALAWSRSDVKTRYGGSWQKRALHSPT